MVGIESQLNAILIVGGVAVLLCILCARDIWLRLKFQFLRRFGYGSIKIFTNNRLVRAFVVKKGTTIPIDDALYLMPAGTDNIVDEHGMPSVYYSHISTTPMNPGKSELVDLVSPTQMLDIVKRNEYICKLELKDALEKNEKMMVVLCLLAAAGGIGAAVLSYSNLQQVAPVIEYIKSVAAAAVVVK